MKMAAHSSIDSLTELSVTTKNNSKSDNIFSPTNDHRQHISPGYDNNNSVFQASIENINVGGGAMDNAPVNQTPEVAIYTGYLQYVIAESFIHTNFEAKTNVNYRQSATMARPRKVVQNKSRKNNYHSQLDSLFDINNNISTPSELYSDVSSDKQSYDSDDEDCSENNDHDEHQAYLEKTENANVLESIKDFINSDEKTSPKINDGLVNHMNKGQRTRVNEDEFQELTKKYDKPANVSSLKVPRVNIGIWKQKTSMNKDVDVKLQRVQNLLSKAACPLMYMLDMFVDKSSKQEGMTKKKIQTLRVQIRISNFKPVTVK